MLVLGSKTHLRFSTILILLSIVLGVYGVGKVKDNKHESGQWKENVSTGRPVKRELLSKLFLLLLRKYLVIEYHKITQCREDHGLSWL